MEFQPMLIGAGAVFLGLVVLVVRATIRRTGRWGINLRARTCPVCGMPSPGVRLPHSLRQALWGGWTCTQCGAELDKWGVKIAQQTNGGDG